MYKIGIKIREYRELQQITQTNFGKMVGVSSSRVSNWENGMNRPNVDVLAKICESLNVSADVLLDISISPKDISEKERKLIDAYRQKCELQYAVDVLLGIQDVAEL